MTPASRTAFLDERRKGIGGSDIASVFSVGYGCARRLWYDKTGTPADFPDEDSGPMKLGRWLEPHIAEEYSEITGRRVTEEPQYQHPDHPELLVHIDRTIHFPDRPEVGVLEIKAFGRGMFAKMHREGMPIDYVLQLQHGMLVTGREVGAFAAMNRDSGALDHWDATRDPAACNEILDAAPAFWQSVVDRVAPDALDPDDKRCQFCRWRRTCQGNALVESATSDLENGDDLAPILAEYDERKALAEEADALLDETKEVLKTALVDRQAVSVQGRKVYHRPQSRSTWDTKGLTDAHRRALGYVDYDGNFMPRPALEVERKFKQAGAEFKVLRIY